MGKCREKVGGSSKKKAKEMLEAGTMKCAGLLGIRKENVHELTLEPEQRQAAASG